MKKLEQLQKVLTEFLYEEAEAISKHEILVLPPDEKETIEEPGSSEVNAYPLMDKIEPKNSKAKAAYIDSATSRETSFIFVIEELNGSEEGAFQGRAAIVCTHGGKIVYAATSFPQMGKKPIPTNYYRMIPTRGSSMPAWVKPYLD